MKKVYFGYCFVVLLFVMLLYACAPAPALTATPTESPLPTAALSSTVQADAPFTVYSHPELSGRLAFTTSNHDIYVMNADGSGLTHRYHAESFINNLSWSPDGKQVAYWVQITAPKSDKLYVMDPKGIREIPLDVLGAGDLFWEPDGQRIRFGCNDDETGQSGVCVVKADGSEPAEIYNPNNIPDLYKGVHFSINWSPDGTKFTIPRRTTSPGEVAVMNIDGTEIATLTGGRIIHWSPDGQKIGFSNTEWNEFGLFTQNIDGTGKTTVLVQEGSYPVEFAWSPDGKKMAFINGCEIGVMNIDGTDLITLAQGCSEDYPVNNYSISWAP